MPLDGKLIAVLVLLAFPGPACADCKPETVGCITLTREEISVSGTTFIAVVTESRKLIQEKGQTLSLPTGTTTRIFDLQSYDSTPLSEVSYDGTDTAKTTAIDLPWLRAVDVIGRQQGGSGATFFHSIIQIKNGVLSLVSPQGLKHSNMGGFYVGEFNIHGNHRGLIVWDALWNGGTHYSEHPYVITYYLWRGGSFSAYERATTGKLPSEKDSVPNLLHLPSSGVYSFTDDTQPPLSFSFPYGAPFKTN
jgi:hypothetical protein